MSGSPIHSAELNVVIERYVDGYVAQCKALHTNGYAPTVIGALEDLIDSLRIQGDVWDRANPDELSPSMQSAQRAYKTLTGEG